MNILICGAGIAGPALAWALRDRGHRLTVVEKATALRTGGQAVDFRGPVHRAVLDRLELWDPISARRTRPSPFALIDRHGTVRATLPSVFTAGDLEIVRGDLCALLHERTSPFTEYRFGDRVAEFAQDSSGVDVLFASGRRDRFDLVVGADGLRSGVRARLFDAEENIVRTHGYALATWSLENVIGWDGTTLSYAEPGRSLTVSQDRAGRVRAMLMFTCDEVLRASPEERVAWLRRRFAGAGWKIGAVLEHLGPDSDLYVDALATVNVGAYARGRVVLLGDAAWGGTIGGQGTSLAIVGAWVLANELEASRGDIATALATYEQRMRPYATDCQKGAVRAGSFHAPRTRLGIHLSRAIYGLMTTPLLLRQLEKMVKASASAFVLPEYGASAGGA